MGRQKESGQDELRFEDCLAQLEQIVQQLEGGGLGLAESLGKYEQGVKHLKVCYKALDEAERRIEMVAGVDANADPIAEPFIDEPESLEEKQKSRSQRRSSTSGTPRRGKSDLDEPGGLF